MYNLYVHISFQKKNCRNSSLALNRNKQIYIRQLRLPDGWILQRAYKVHKGSPTDCKLDLRFPRRETQGSSERLDFNMDPTDDDVLLFLR